MESTPKFNSNIHANTIVIGKTGLLIRGETGIGKTQLSLFLVEKALARDSFAVLVADDQTLLSPLNGRLIARCPATISNNIEIRGFGLKDQRSLSSTVIHLVVDIVASNKIERMPARRVFELGNIRLPAVKVPSHDENHAGLIIQAALDAATLGSAEPVYKIHNH